MNNIEWLDSLSLDELSAWMGAEHAEPPEGDAVAIMRRALDNQSSPTFCALARYLGISGGLSVSWAEAEDALRVLADMVERDYVSRQDFAAQHRTLCGVREQRDEWKAKAEQAERAMNVAAGKWARADARSAERVAAVKRLRECRDLSTSDLMCAMAGFGHEPHTGEQWRDALIDLLTDEGSSKVRVGSSNLEWLFEHDYETLCDQMGGQPCSCCVVGCEEDLGSDEACTKALREWLMAPHEEETVYQSEFTNSGKPYRAGDAVLDAGVICPIRMMDAQSDCNGTYPNAMGQSSTSSKAHSKTEPNLTEHPVSWSDLYGILWEENAPETPDSAENPQKMPEQGADFPANANRAESIADLLGQTCNVTDEGLAYLAKWHLPSVISMLRDYEDEKLMRDCDLEMNVLLPTEGLQAKVDELQAEIAKRDKGIERLKKRRDELEVEVERLRAELNTAESDNEYLRGTGRKPTDAVREFAERYETRIEELERLWHSFEDEVAAQSVEIAERDKRIAELEDELHRAFNAQTSKAEELTLRGARIAELQGQVDMLTERKCPGYEPESHSCRYHAQDFALNNTTVSRLKRENARLTKERDRWRMRCGELLDAAHAMQTVADSWEVNA